MKFKNSLFIIIFIIFSACSSLQEKKNTDQMNLKEFITAVEKTKKKNRQKFIDKNFDFIIAKSKIPYIEGDQITFVYRGKDKNLQLGIVAPNKDKIYLKKIDGTDLFYYTGKFYFEPNARINYTFGTDNGWMIDPLNPYISNEFFRLESELRMPEYKEHKEAVYSDNIEHGNIISEFYESVDIVASKRRKNNNKTIQRPVDIYLPYNYDPDKKYKVIYFNDGSGYINAINACNTLDYMIYHKEIEPLIAVFVTPFARLAEYMKYREEYADYFVNDLMPKIESKYPIIASPEGRTIAGASAAANIGVFTAYRYPDLFGNVLCQSGVLGINSYFEDIDYGKNKELFGRNIVNHRYPVQIYLSAGNYEYQVLNSAKIFYNDMKNNKTVKAVTLYTEPQGHHQAFWRDTLRGGLLWLSKKHNNLPDKIVEKNIEIKINKNLILNNAKEKLNIAIVKLKKSPYKTDSYSELYDSIEKVVAYETLDKDEYYTDFFVKSDEALSHYLLIPFKDNDRDGKYNFNEIKDYEKTIDYIRSNGIKDPKEIKKEFDKRNFESFINMNNPSHKAVSHYVAVSNLDNVIIHNSNF